MLPAFTKPRLVRGFSRCALHDANRDSGKIRPGKVRRYNHQGI